jgi:hypothetical protein
MATKTMLKKGSNLIGIIQREGSIHKFDLIDKASISLSTYNQMKPYLEYRYAQYVRYDEKTGIWSKQEDEK